MKNIIFLFALLPFLAFGQVTRDTIITVDTLVFREITLVQGTTTTTTRTLIGESQAQAVAHLVGLVTPEADRYARQAVTFARRGAIRQVTQPINALLQQYTGSNYTANAGAVLGDAILGTYRYRKNGGGDLTTTIIRLQGGGLRFRHNDTNYTVRVVSRRWITVLAFDNVPELNLYWDSDRAEWISLDLLYNLKRL
jgi:hypothetical protein